MIKSYPKKTSEPQMKPKKETVQFLIDFSKCYHVEKTKSDDSIELNLN